MHFFGIPSYTHISAEAGLPAEESGHLLWGFVTLLGQGLRIKLPGSAVCQLVPLDVLYENISGSCFM